MKTLISEINGRSDYPIFNVENNTDIVKWLERDYGVSEVEMDEDDSIRVIFDDGMEDIFRIVEKEIIDYRNI